MPWRTTPILIAEAERKKLEAMRDAITIKISSLTQHEARSIGCENLCHSTLRMLKIREYLTMRGWERTDIDIALMQIIARAIYPYSELKTVRYLKENTALAEIFRIPKEKITKDVLYNSALRLWEEHRGLEDWLHERVCDIFNIEEKILLFDITNTYFEGRYDQSKICQYGRSKEKRNDCKIVVLAAVVNTEGTGRKEIATAMTWKRNDGKTDEVKKFHGKYVLLTSLDESDEVNIWKFYNVIRTVEETFHVLKTDLDIRPVYHKSDGGIKAHLNLAVLAYWLVSVTRHRLKTKGYENVRWDEIMHIASTQVIVTAQMKTTDGDTVRVRQSTEAEDKLSAIYSLLDINPHPLGRIKSVVHKNQPQKKNAS